MSPSIDQSVASNVLPDGVMCAVVRSRRTRERATRRIDDPESNAIVSPPRAKTKYRVEAVDATAPSPTAIATAFGTPNPRSSPRVNATTAVPRTKGSQERVRCHIYTALATSTSPTRSSCADLISSSRLIGQGFPSITLWVAQQCSVTHNVSGGVLLRAGPLTGRRQGLATSTIQLCRAMPPLNLGIHATVLKSRRRRDLRQRTRPGSAR